MNPQDPSGTDESQREALRESQRRATEGEPENFKDESTDEKVVEIGPEMDDDPIHGIDPPEKPGSSR